MNASPELYYELEYRQHERALERAAAYRRNAELHPEQVVPYVSVFARTVTKLKGFISRLRGTRQTRAGASTARAGTETSTDAARRPSLG